MRPPSFLMALNWQFAAEVAGVRNTHGYLEPHGRFLGERVREVEPEVGRLDVGVGEDGGIRPEGGDARSDGGLARTALAAGKENSHQASLFEGRMTVSSPASKARTTSPTVRLSTSWTVPMPIACSASKALGPM